MGFGQYYSIGEYCGSRTASSVFLILIVLMGHNFTNSKISMEMHYNRLPGAIVKVFPMKIVVFGLSKPNDFFPMASSA